MILYHRQQCNHNHKQGGRAAAEAGEFTDAQKAAADVDGIGEVTSYDARLVLKKVAEME